MTETIWEQSFNIPAIRSSLPKGYELQVIGGELYRWIDYNKVIGEFTTRRDLAILTAWIHAVGVIYD